MPRGRHEGATRTPCPYRHFHEPLRRAIAVHLVCRAVIRGKQERAGNERRGGSMDDEASN